MRLRYVFCLTVAALLTAAGVSAQTVAYVSAGSQIHAVSGNGSSAVIHTAATNVGDLTFGADGRLYYAEPTANRIGRIDPNGQVTGKGVNTTDQNVFTSESISPRELRLDSKGNLFFATASSGVCSISLTGTLPAGPPSCPSSFADGSGLAFTHGGELISTQGAQIQIPGQPAVNVVGSQLLGLGVASGGDNSLKFDTRQGSLNTGDILVSKSAAVGNDGDAIFRYSKAAAQLGAYVSAAGLAGRYIRHAELALDDTLWFAASLDPVNPTNAANGQLFRFNGSTLVKVWNAPKKSGKYPPSIGVALPPTSRTITETTADVAHEFKFGPNLVHVESTLSCKVSVTATQKSDGDDEAQLHSLNNPGNEPGPVTYETVRPLGEESWKLHFEVSAVDAPCADTSNPATVFIAGFLETQSLGVLRCEGPSCAPVTIGFFPFFQPDDGAGRGTGFSIWMLANVAATDQQGSFPYTLCGPDSPLNVMPPVTPPLADTTNAPVYNLGQSLTFKVHLGTPDCGAFSEAPAPNYPLSGVMMSIQKVNPVETFIIFPKGQSGEPPVFRKDLTDPTKLIFNLDTTPAPGANWTGGGTAYVATISSLNGQFAAKSVVFKLN